VDAGVLAATSHPMQGEGENEMRELPTVDRTKLSSNRKEKENATLSEDLVGTAGSTAGNFLWALVILVVG